MLDAAVLAAVASPRRREILRLVWDGPRSAGEIARAMPDVTFGAVSLQLRSLLDAGLVECDAQRQQRFYRARRTAFGSLARELERMWSDALWRLKLQAELEASRRGPRPSARRRPREHARERAARNPPHRAGALGTPRTERGSWGPASERVGGPARAKPLGSKRTRPS